MQSEGTLEVLFCDAKVDSEEAFLRVFANPTNLAVFAFKDSQLAAMAWLNQMQHDHAQAHYWFAKKVWGASALTVGKEILDFWFRFTAKDSGEPLFKVIVGQTPSGNRRSVAFNKRLGFTFVGTIPKVYKGGVDIYFLENPYGKE